METNQILTGDYRVLSRLVPDESVDLVLTDPPFGIGFQYSHDYKDDPNDYEDLIRRTIAESDRVIKPGGLCFVFVAQLRLRHIWHLFPEDSRIFAAVKNFTQYRPITVQYGYDPALFWQKPGDPLVESFAGKRDWCKGNTALYVTRETFHSCPRPLDAIIYMIDNFAPIGGLVVDWFMGSGTTAVACKMVGRNWWGCEIDPEMAEKARERVHQSPFPLLVSGNGTQVTLDAEATQATLWAECENYD